MKARAQAAMIVLLLTLAATEHRQESTSSGIPAPPPPQSDLEGRRAAGECAQPICPQPVCPQPVCPPLPPFPKCPPPAPAPTVRPVPCLSCPQPSCPTPSCPACPDCPRANVSCPQPVCPSAQACPAKGATCSGCMWKVLVSYDHFQGFGFYKAYNTKVDWHQAKTLCDADGGHLAVINSDKEAELFKLMYQKNQFSGGIFIGIHNLDDQKWKAVTGEPLAQTGYMKWRPGEPTGGNEHCAEINEHALINDIRCDWRNPFLCEVNEEKAFAQ